MNKTLQAWFNWLKAMLLPAAGVVWLVGLAWLVFAAAGDIARAAGVHGGSKTEVGLRILLAGLWTLVFCLAVSLMTAPPGTRWTRARSILLAGAGAGLYVAGLAGVLSLVGDGFAVEFGAAIAFTVSVLGVLALVLRGRRVFRSLARGLGLVTGAVVLVGGLFVVLEPFYDESLDAMALTGILLPVSVAYVVGVLAVGLVVYRIVVTLRTTTGRFDVEVTAAPPEAWTALSEERPLFDSGSARIELGDHGATRLGETLSRPDAETLVELLRRHGGEAKVISADRPSPLRL